ncbi:MAG: gamma carbonic anhydrase family protein [Actinobacteria bacterium]|nr:gamma carbonic anhydrase family protein [Actinomycetota bacterium]
MPIYALGSQQPTIDSSAYVHPDAVIIGSVFIGPNSSVWPTAVLRGDDGEIHVGARTSIQDGTVVHTTLAWPTRIGDDCVIGHLAHLEACIIENGAQVSSGAIVLHRARVCTGAIVGANSVVLNDTVVPAKALAVGSPAVIKEGRARAEDIAYGAENYVQRTARFKRELRRID